MNTQPIATARSVDAPVLARRAREAAAVRPDPVVVAGAASPVLPVLPVPPVPPVFGVVAVDVVGALEVVVVVDERPAVVVVTPARTTIVPFMST